MFIYSIRHTASGREYIGQTVVSVSKRWAHHRCDAIHGRCSGYLHRALRKYGPSAFTIELLAIASTKEELDALEQQFIKERNTRAPNGFNYHEGGSTGSHGLSPSVETRAKQAASMRGKPAWNKGRSMSPEELERHRLVSLAAANTSAQVAARSRPKSAETRAKIAATLTGRRLTDEQRTQWSLVAKRNRRQVAATKAAWTPAQREEVRRNHAEARRQWWARLTPEQRDALKQQRSATSRAVWARRNAAVAA